MGRILIVDDEPDIRILIQDILCGIATHTEACGNGYQAFAKLENGSFDLVITDIVMPDVDGLELLKKLREDAAFRHIKILAISGGAHAISARNALRAAALYADNILYKPFDPAVLKDEVVDLLGCGKKTGPLAFDEDRRVSCAS